MLTGQVFAIMGGVAENEQTSRIVKAADHYLYQKEVGGYRLNTDFKELKFDMGRMFGFAYGEKRKRRGLLPYDGHVRKRPVPAWFL